MMPLAEAVRAADAAFVGTLVEVGTEPVPLPAEDAKGVGRPDVLGEPVVYAWQVERSRDAGTPATLNVAAAQDDGANCGMTFTADQRWLVVATLEGGMLATNGCMPNGVIDGVRPGGRGAVVSLMVAPADEPAASDGAPRLGRSARADRPRRRAPRLHVRLGLRPRAFCLSAALKPR